MRNLVVLSEQCMVHLALAADESVHCMGCRMANERMKFAGQRFPSTFGHPREVIDHLLDHRTAGHAVPDDVFELMTEMAMQRDGAGRTDVDSPIWVP